MIHKTKTQVGITGSFLGIPPRVQLRRWDNATGSYPTILRTGDKDRSGKTFAPFNDNKTIVLNNVPAKSGSKNQRSPAGVFMVYPQVLPVNSLYQIFPSSSLGVARSGSFAALPARSRYEIDWNPSANNLSPFDDSRVILTASQPGSMTKANFFSTGSSETVVAGFSQRLADKVQVVIDVSSDTSCDIYVGTGSTSSESSRNINTGLVYYNPTLRAWEPHGVHLNGVLTGSNANLWQNNLNGQTSSMAVQASQRTTLQNNDGGSWGSRGGLFKGVSVGGWPNTFKVATSRAGWPFAEKFNATSSQYINMSDYIQHPFLVEKMVYQFTSSWGGPGGRETAAYTRNTHGSRFHVIRQSPDPAPQPAPQMDFDVDLELNYFEGYVAGAQGEKSITAHFRQTRIRDIVGYFDVKWSKSGLQGDININDSRYGKRLNRDLTLNNSGGYDLGGNASTEKQVQAWLTGTYTVGFDARQPKMWDHISLTGCPAGVTGKHQTEVGSNKLTHIQTQFADDARRNNIAVTGFDPSIVEKSFGGANGQALGGNLLTSPRSILLPDQVDYDIADVSEDMGIEIPKTFTWHLGSTLSSATTRKWIIPAAQQYRGSPNPYVLLPEDKLILSWAHQNFSASWSTTQHVQQTIPHGPGKIVLFGSVLRDQGPVLNQTLNQNLTSDNVHEAVHDIVVDQYDVNHRHEYINTYSDRFITGSMFAPKTNPGSAQPANEVHPTRKRLANPSSGSLKPYFRSSTQRFVRLSDPAEQFFDTVMPDIAVYCRRAVGFSRIAEKKPEGKKNSIPMVIFSPEDFYLEKEANRMPFPYDGNPKRLANDTLTIQASSVANSNAARDPISHTLGPVAKGIVQRNRLLFQVGRQEGDFFSYSIGVTDNDLYLTTYGAANTDNRASPPVPKTGTGAIGKTVDATSQQGCSGSSSGFRYGIKNITPEYSSVVFRRDRYGQFRDMLEQRQFSRFFTDGLPSDSAVEVIYTHQTSSRRAESPSNTRSSNLDKHATSSLPYFDGNFRNRSTEVGTTDQVSVIFGGVTLT